MWKQKKKVTAYKCANRKCPCRISNLDKLTRSEKFLQKMVPTHFTINYIYREYHLTQEDIKHSAPRNLGTKIFRINKSDNVLGLILAFYVSFAISARKTAFILQQMFQIPVSHQTVLNYARAAAYYCHKFNLQNKSSMDSKAAGDETYIKIAGKNYYLFLFISVDKKAIISYHLADNRGAIPAVATINEAVRTLEPEEDITCITDGNPAYAAAILFLNRKRKNKIVHKKVIGLQNLDQESTDYREFKQIIERLNRTYKFHVRPAEGFGSFNGAMALTALFVTHYNFLRPHTSLKYNVPIHITGLDNFKTIQAKWIAILNLAALSYFGSG